MKSFDSLALTIISQACTKSSKRTEDPFRLEENSLTPEYLTIVQRVSCNNRKREKVCDYLEQLNF